MITAALLAAASCQIAPLRDKTLVAWVRILDLDSRGGSVLTLQNDAEEFDALVYGEIAPRRWMPGSEFFQRTPRDQETWPEEGAAPDRVVQVAAAWREREVALFRDGRELVRFTIERAREFDADAIAVVGLRHLAAGDRASFRGAVLDARIYGEALGAAALRALEPDVRGEPAPVAWWPFEGGSTADSMGRFPPGRLAGAARIERGELVLSGAGACFVAGGEPPRTRATEEWPVWHLSALPDEGVCLPYDSNGCLFWRGRYHLMYIFQDPGLPHGGHCWGHASSADLVDWTFHPAALVPRPGDPDRGIFSGNAFVGREGRPMLGWFGIDAGVCVATARDDDLLDWEKHPANPIIPIPRAGDPGHGVYQVWDPYLWFDGERYLCLLGGNSLPDGKDTLYAARSHDLVEWELLHPFFEHPDPAWTVAGEDCSCPDFFALGERHVLLCISHKTGARAYVGRFDREAVKFHPERHERMNWPGGAFFAPESLVDGRGRRIFWAWITDPRSMTTQRATGSGVQSLPRVLELAADGSLRVAPAPELAALRRERIAIAAALLPPGRELLLDGVLGDVMELELDIDPGTADETGVAVRCSPDGSEETVIRYRPSTRTLSIDVARSTKRRDVRYSEGPLDAYGGVRSPRTSVDAPLALAAGEPLRLRLFLDRPVVEVFANGRQCVTQQVFPSGPDSLGVKAFARGGAARLLGGTAWRLAPARFIDARGRRR